MNTLVRGLDLGPTICYILIMTDFMLLGLYLVIGLLAHVGFYIWARSLGNGPEDAVACAMVLAIFWPVTLFVIVPAALLAPAFIKFADCTQNLLESIYQWTKRK